jgi:hypothetical protein
VTRQSAFRSECGEVRGMLGETMFLAILVIAFIFLAR